MNGILEWWRQAIENILPARRLIIVDGDSLPSKLPKRALVLARDDGEDWCVGMRCPCGCGSNIELLVIKEAKPRWDIATDHNLRPTLSPSVWRKNGCRAHFWVRDGRVIWCR